MLIFLFVASGCGQSNPNAEQNSTDGNSTERNSSKPAISTDITRLELPFKAQVYNQLTTTLITSQAELEQLITTLTSQRYELDKQEQFAQLEKVAIDFSKENLLIYQMSESSGSIALNVKAPTLKGDAAFVSITRHVPEMGTTDMAYYALFYRLSHTIKTITFTEGNVTTTLRNAKPAICPAIYAPVCGAKAVHCVTSPCEPQLKTYANSCELGLDGKVQLLYAGECLPSSCKQWNDGCNTCSFSEFSGTILCTMMACEKKDRAYCLDD